MPRGRKKSSASTLSPQAAPEQVVAAEVSPVGAEPRKRRGGRTAKMSPSGNDTISEEIVLQYDGAEWPVSALKEKAIASYIAEGHRRGNIKNFSLYLKADERKAYYVVNGKAAGSVDFD